MPSLIDKEFLVLASKYPVLAILRKHSMTRFSGNLNS